MSLLEEIQNEAVSSTSDLGSLLRKCKVLAARLGSQQLEDWLLWESNGYPDTVDVPDYRIWPLEIKGHFCRTVWVRNSKCANTLCLSARAC